MNATKSVMLDFKLCCVKECKYPATHALRVASRVFPFCPKHKGSRYCPIDREKVINYELSEFC